MNSQTERASIAGPAGTIECALDGAAENTRGIAVIAHPHPLHGGTMDNKVVQTLARAFVQQGWRTVRFNFRGIGSSAGSWDEGRGEIDDMLAVIEKHRGAGEPLALAGFSFGAYVASHAAQRVGHEQVRHLVLIGPATRNFEVAQVPSGTVVIHGEQDDVVPLQATFDWARPQSLPVVVVPGVGHFFHGQLPLLKNLVVRALA
nr:alpha/beta fold hydrolase [uncultured Caldimonas sp.]